ncbi:MAG TPA: CHRD domain-containing protein [Gaiellaceae bacterium]|nr:CHRD domain-containing protein [Gaiellaceae bacterium]
MRRAIIGLGVSLLALVAVLVASAATSATKFEVALKGSNESPAAAASNKGTVELTLNAKTGKVCWDFKLGHIDGKPNQAHIHKGRRGVSGNVVVPLGATYKREGCTTASKALVRSILRSPGGFYVNVHNAKHPLGAMRGQL